MWLRGALVWAALLCVTVAHAQTTDPPMLGPLLAVNTAEQDRILIYDAGDNFARRELSFGSGWHQVWDFSPDGCRIAFTLSDGVAPARLYTAGIDGSDLREMVQFDELPPEDWGVWNPRWSPAGDRIAFVMVRDVRPPGGGDATREYHIAWVDAGGGVPDFYSVTGDEHEPVWSPDGSWLAYIGYERRPPGADPLSTVVPGEEPNTPESTWLHEAALWVVSADGSTKYRLTYFDVGSVRAPRWSPDGQLLSFVYSPTPNNDQFYMIANADGAIPTQLSFSWSLILDTTWLPDSTAILGAARQFQDVRQNRLWRVPLVGNADTDAVPYITSEGSVPIEVDYADYPRFSPDGDWLALRSAYNVTVYQVKTGALTVLDPEIFGNTPPVWSPSGFNGEATCP